MSDLRIVFADADAEEFALLRIQGEFPAQEANPLRGDFGLRYYGEVFGDRWQDSSFLIAEGAQALINVRCGRLDSSIGDFDMPVLLAPAADASRKQVRAGLRIAVETLSAIAREHGATLRVEDRPDGPAMTELGTLLHVAGAEADIQFRAGVDLRAGEPAKQLRKSYKSLVNWGKRSLALSSVDANNPDRNLFQRFRDLHRKVAGKVTRSDRSWDIQFDEIANGRGELIMGALPDGDWVSGSLVIDGALESSYVSAAYDHTRFDKPLSHWPMLCALEHARARGIAWFDLGEVPFKSRIDLRGFNVGRFKKGFVDAPVAHLIWRLHGSASAAA